MKGPVWSGTNREFDPNFIFSISCGLEIAAIITGIVKNVSITQHKNHFLW